MSRQTELGAAAAVPAAAAVGARPAAGERCEAGGGGAPAIRRFVAPFAWPEIDAEVEARGVAIVAQLVSPSAVARLSAELDAWLERHPEVGPPASGSGLYDAFLGRRTVRLHGLAAKLPSGPALIAHPEIAAFAARALQPAAPSILLNAGELIQIGPGEPAQLLHRDTDSWPALSIGGAPVLVNAIVALSEFTPQTGATVVAPGSHRWPRERQATEVELGTARLRPGDVLLLRGDVLHGGGANRTRDVRRRGVSLSFCAGWLRPVENSFLNVPPAIAARLPAAVQDLLGYRTNDATATGGGVLGLFENGDPRRFLAALAEIPDGSGR